MSHRSTSHHAAPADPIIRVALIAALLGTLVAFTRPAPDVVQARRIELINAEGKARAVLTADTGAVVLTLFDKSGRIAGSLQLNADPRLAVLDPTGRELAGLGAPRAQHLAQ